jgi:O-antigen ligase
MTKGRRFFDYEPVTRSGRAKARSSETAAGAEGWPTHEAELRPARVDETHHVDDAAHAVEAHADKSYAESLEDSLPLPPAPRVEKAERWSIRRGHALSYAGLFFYTLLIYYRPADIFEIPSLVSLSYWVAIVTLLAFLPSQLVLEGTLTARPREVNLILLLFLAGLLSIPLALNPAEAWAEFNFLFAKAVIMFIVMINVMRTERRLKWMIFLAVSIGCVISFGALNNYRAGSDGHGEFRVVGNIGLAMFGNQNDMALHLVTMIPIVIAFLLKTRNLLMKALYGACALLMMAGNFVTYSRGAFLGLIGGGLVLAWKLSRRSRLVVILLIFLGVGAAALIAPGGYANRIASIADPNSDLSASTRRQLLYGSIIVALRHPLLGVGMGNDHNLLVRGQVSHNSYTQVASEMGMAALLVYLMFLIVPLKRLKRIERETFSERRGSHFYYLAVGLQSSLVCYMITSFFLSVAYVWNGYYLVGYAVCLRRLYATRPDALRSNTEVLGQQSGAVGQQSFEADDELGQRGALALEGRHVV